jgi:uncharacterized delta-60 repeat protein
MVNKKNIFLFIISSLFTIFLISLIVTNNINNFVYSNSNKLYNDEYSLIKNNPTMGEAIAIDNNNKILIVGEMFFPSSAYYMTIWKINPDGSLDTSFNKKGFVQTELGYSIGRSIIIDKDNNILVTGSISSRKSRMIVWKFNNNGFLDKNFANKGILQYITYSNGNSIMIDKNGKILICGYIYRESIKKFIMTIWRYDKNGIIDTTFGNKGSVSYFVPHEKETNYIGNCIVTDKKGKIIICGEGYSDNSNLKMILWKYQENGAPDNSFGNKGIVTFPNSCGISTTIDKNNKILVTGYTLDSIGNKKIIIFRFNSDGSLDTSFNKKGYTIYNSFIYDNTNEIKSKQDRGISITIDNNEKIIVTGGISIIPKKGFCATTPGCMILLRYNPDGSLDTSFNKKGFVTYNKNYSSIGSSITLDKNGKILVVGSISINYKPFQLTLWKYNNNGTLDGSFNKNVTQIF